MAICGACGSHKVPRQIKACSGRSTAFTPLPVPSATPGVGPTVGKSKISVCAIGRGTGGAGSYAQAFVTHLLEDGYDIRTEQELLGHKDIQTTMVYTRVLNRGGRGVHSPLDRLRKAVSSESSGIIRTGRSA